MAGEANITVVRKKVTGGHGGAHGGAWKVAYADFVTAMMAFFLVMWLMGADEETKKSIAQYFNNYTPFTASDSINKNGSNAGGDASWRTDGDQGRYEMDTTMRPTATAPVYLDEQTTLDNLSDNVYDGASFSKDTDAEKVKLNVPGSISFTEGSVEIPLESYKYLAKLTGVIKEYDGVVDILGFADEAEVKGSKNPENDLWSLSFKRAMAVYNYFLTNGLPKEKLIPTAAINKILPTKSDKEHNRKVRFIMKHTRK